ncbi:MAG: DNA topoisomerase IV subunit A [Intestinibaculum porci]|uniref:DNA topoisomerase IV subunit A n=1 Tax=Intestinibaculum porci TaxID=2487118 RepID=UPI002409CD0A|nr:DNA topoisomerase IV subunit A [Intestinibaculum porci]MDD6422989.1 DNA topoisomerase IV subunit A [Intestinibaculum porci]
MMENDSKILKMSLDDIMGDRFGRYSKYIIQDRALPDVRDGLKPVQRRILYAMYKEGNLPNKPYRKSAKTVGVVIGNYHPHGDSSVDEAMVRLSQEWKMRMPLVDMQGNNGSIDNDPAAAMRYTEARLAPIALELLRDIDKDTVEMALNFDDTEYEPTVLPAKYPNLLVNGATGISAGYATDIPPHNLGEVIDATIYRIKHPHCTFEQLHKYIKGPDFPTGGIVEGSKEIANALRKGRGKVIVRSQTAIEEKKNMNQIVITEIPYEVNKAELVRKIDEIRFNRDIDGILEVRDESDRTGLRIVIDLKKDVDANNTLNYFFKNTDLQKNYSYNMTAIKDKRPELMGIEEIIDGYINHEIEVVTRSSLFDLEKAKKREHIVEGLIKAVSILDEVVHTIRQSKDKADAKKNLMAAYGFTEAQAEAIVMLQLYRLTNTDIVALQNEQNELQALIAHLQAILDSDEVLRGVIIDDLKAIKKKYPTPRLTKIQEEVRDTSIDDKAMIISEDCLVSLTRDGYLKKISLRSYKASAGTPIGKKDDDQLCALFEANTVQTILAFTNKGNYCFIPVHKIDEFKWKDLGKHISYLIKVPNDEKFIGAILVKDFQSENYVVLASRQGQIKRVAIKDFEVSRFSKPLKCMNLKDQDELIDVQLSDGHKGLVLTSKAGYCALYSESEVSILGIKAGGIKGLRLNNDTLAFMRVFDPLKVESLMIFSHPSGIKRLHLSDIPATKRGNKGVLIYKAPKTKQTSIINGFVMDTNDTLDLYGGQEMMTITAKDYNFMPLSSRMGTIKDFKDTDISYIYDARMLIAEPHAEETGDMKVDLEVKAEPSLFDEEEVETIEPVKKKEVKKKKEKTKFEPISFDDLLKDDNF